ncbi:DUF2637 domain-containing protein [Streptomyces sp. RKAG337]|nr:DUF2637 domain-containing protein [Streptomyces sp. RKAG337]MCM2427553.1 DUF2637 domain-containing protein [Streptomyces sp. RKAG337]
MKHSAPRALTMAAAGVIVALTVAAFWLSYAHLQSVAAAYGLAQSPARAWAWPATLDLFIVAGELLLLRASLTARTDWWAVGLTVTGSGGSIALNISGVGAHAHTLAYVVAAVPPTAALLAFGALMRQVHDALAASADRTADAPEVAPDIIAATDAIQPEEAGQAATAPEEETTPPAPHLEPKPRRTKQAPGAGKTARPVRTDDELLAHLRELRTSADGPLSQRAVLAALGIGVPRLRALLDEHGLTLDPLPAPPRSLALVGADRDRDDAQPDTAAAL